MMACRFWSFANPIFGMELFLFAKMMILASVKALIINAGLSMKQSSFSQICYLGDIVFLLRKFFSFEWVEN